jgi:hypothetical protein
MRSFLRLALIALLAALLLAVPAYLLLRAGLSSPSGEMMPGLFAMLFAPAVGFPVFLAILFIPSWWFGWRVDPWTATLYGAFAVVLYLCVISAYVVYFQAHSGFRNMNVIQYFVTRLLLWSMPSFFAAAIVTSVATWIVSKFLPQA